MSKLNNIEAIKKMMSGDHAFQTKRIIYSDKFNNDITDSDQIEQKNGFKIKHGKLNSLSDLVDTMFKPQNCLKENCTCIKPSELDNKMITIHSMCFDCVIEHEHDLRIKGEYNKYETNIKIKNAKAWLKDVLSEKETLKDYVKHLTFNQSATSTVSFHGKTIDDIDSIIDEYYEKLEKDINATIEDLLINVT